MSDIQAPTPTRNRVLTHLLSQGKTLHVPGSFDALSAQLVAEAGFPVGYVGSAATAASRLGAADVGLVTLSDLVEQARAVVAATRVPVIADAEGGLFGAANIWRTVSAFEGAGVSAIHIEDHAGGKHTELEQHLIPIDIMAGKIAAAVAARRDPEFRIIARTDALWVGLGLDEAVDRLTAYIAAGADMVFPTGVDRGQAEEIRSRLEAPLVVVGGQDFGWGQEFDGVASVVIYYGICLLAASRAIVEALELFRSTSYGDERMSAVLDDVTLFESRMGYDSYADRVRRFGS